MCVLLLELLYDNDMEALVAIDNATYTLQRSCESNQYRSCIYCKFRHFNVAYNSRKTAI